MSVVIPTFDREQLLMAAIAALARQDYPPHRYEVVVVDNGSNDGTAESLSRVGVPRLRVVRIEQNLPPAEARNHGIAVSAGEIIAFTDSDCRPVPGWISALVGAMAEGIDVVQGETTADPTQSRSALSRTQWVPAELGLYETCNIAYRRWVLEATGGFRLEVPDRMRVLLGDRLAGHAFGEDVDLGWRARAAGAITRFEPGATVHHEVFEEDLRYLFGRSMLVAGFPLLARLHPGLRDTFFYRRWFLTRRRVDVGLALIGLASGRRIALLAAIPYLYRLIRESRPSGRDAPRVAGVRLLQDMIETASLAYGSLRERSIVL